jgi:hypothetical protein
MRRKTMQRFQVVAFTAVLAALPLAARAVEVPPMVEKHIFLPGPEDVAEVKSPQAERLEGELLFTGVIITPDGKKALVQEKAKGRRGVDQPAEGGLLKEGDAINGFSIAEIGPNYLLLSGEDGELRLPLYGGGKNRPEAPPVPEPAVVGGGEGVEQPQVNVAERATPGVTGKPSGGQAQGAPADNGVAVVGEKGSAEAKQGGDNPSGSAGQAGPPQRDVTNPLMEGLRRAQQSRGQAGGGTAAPSGPNPFLDIIRRSR